MTVHGYIRLLLLPYNVVRTVKECIPPCVLELGQFYHIYTIMISKTVVKASLGCFTCNIEINREETEQKHSDPFLSQSDRKAKFKQKKRPNEEVIIFIFLYYVYIVHVGMYLIRSVYVGIYNVPLQDLYG